jgi:hypothetical protein
VEVVTCACELRHLAWLICRGATGAMSATRFCVGMLPFRLRPASNGQLRVNGGIVKTVKVLRNVVGSAGLLFMGYVVLTSLPDLRRYIRISTM